MHHGGASEGIRCVGVTHRKVDADQYGIHQGHRAKTRQRRSSKDCYETAPRSRGGGARPTDRADCHLLFLQDGASDRLRQGHWRRTCKGASANSVNAAGLGGRIALNPPSDEMDDEDGDGISSSGLTSSGTVYLYIRHVDSSTN